MTFECLNFYVPAKLAMLYTSQDFRNHIESQRDVDASTQPPGGAGRDSPDSAAAKA